MGDVCSRGGHRRHHAGGIEADRGFITKHPPSRCWPIIPHGHRRLAGSRGHGTPPTKRIHLWTYAFAFIVDVVQMRVLGTKKE